MQNLARAGLHARARARVRPTRDYYTCLYLTLFFLSSSSRDSGFSERSEFQVCYRAYGILESCEGSSRNRVVLI